MCYEQSGNWVSGWVLITSVVSASLYLEEPTRGSFRAGGLCPQSGGRKNRLPYSMMLITRTLKKGSYFLESTRLRGWLFESSGSAAASQMSRPLSGRYRIQAGNVEA